MKSNMPCLQMDPVVLWENIEGGKLLCGVLRDESQKLLKDKPSSWLYRLLNEKNSQYFISILTHGWWQMLCGGGYSNGSRATGTWAAKLWQDIAAQVENLVVKIHHVDAHVPKSCATKEHQNNEQVDQAARIEVAQVDQDWEHKGELFIAQWARDTVTKVFQYARQIPEGSDNISSIYHLFVNRKDLSLIIVQSPFT
ncbi:hypothetical protein QYF61_018885 [Mycteria americana]|uniref:Uncharacterized protein n=1 Tax=Mycteria americana TaxID=33587 RepID=A0AAN7PSB8_MYCAM|nr:hypothetical protein QYF61_018885 [Mycteria americana]